MGDFTRNQDNDSAREAYYSDSGDSTTAGKRTVPYHDFRGRYDAYKAASSAANLSYKAYKHKQKERWSIAKQFFEARNGRNGSSYSIDLVGHDTTSSKVMPFVALVFIILPLLGVVCYALHRFRAGPKKKRAAGR